MNKKKEIRELRIELESVRAKLYSEVRRGSLASPEKLEELKDCEESVLSDLMDLEENND